MILILKKTYRRVILWARRKILYFITVRLSDSYYLDCPIGGAKTRGIKRIGEHACPQNFMRPNYFSSDESCNYSFQRRYVYEIDNVTIDTINDIIYDSEGRLIAESSAWPLYRLLCEVPSSKIVVPAKIKFGTYIYFAKTQNYYHWLLEDLPVFLSAYRYKHDKIITSKKSFSIADEFLEKNFSGRYESHDGLVRVEKLIMSGKTAGLGPPFSHNVIHPTDLKYLSQFFSRDIKKTLHKKIYISRLGHRRQLPNERAISDYLSKNGWDIFSGNKSLYEQIEIFSSADTIMGASGAGLVNMVWMPQGSKVFIIEENSSRYHFYYDLAVMCKHSYEAVDYNIFSLNPDSIFCDVHRGG